MTATNTAVRTAIQAAVREILGGEAPAKATGGNINAAYSKTGLRIPHGCGSSGLRRILAAVLAGEDRLPYGLSWPTVPAPVATAQNPTPAVSGATLAAVAAIATPPAPAPVAAAPSAAQPSAPAADHVVAAVKHALAQPDDQSDTSKLLRQAHVTAGLAKTTSDVAGTATVMRQRLQAWLKGQTPKVDAQKPAPAVAQQPAAPKAPPTAVYPTVYVEPKAELERLEKELGLAIGAATAAAEVAFKAKREFERLDDIARGLKAKVDALRATIANTQATPVATQPAAPAAVAPVVLPAKGSGGTAAAAPTNPNTAATVANGTSSVQRKCQGTNGDASPCKMHPIKGTDYCRHHVGQKTNAAGAAKTNAATAAKPAATDPKTPAATQQTNKPAAQPAPATIAGLYVQDGKGGFRLASEKEVWAALEAATQKNAA